MGGLKPFVKPTCELIQFIRTAFDNFCFRYSIGLIFWELFNRLEVDGRANDYLAPFGDIIPNEPTVEQMQRLVCVDRRSPQFAGRFLDEPVSFFVKKETILFTFSFQFFSSLLCVIRECWCNDPTARLPTLRVQKDIVRFYEQTKK